MFSKERHQYFSSKKMDRIKLFKKNGVDVSMLISKIEETEDADLFELANYTFAQLESTLNICNFLLKEKTEKNHDTEKIIVTMLISLAEALHQINKTTGGSENLIRGFFKPVIERLRYKIRFSQATYGSGDIDELVQLKKDDPLYILYLIRNDYIHNANFLGVVFPSGNITNSFSIGFSEKASKGKIKYATICNDISYEEFISIFFEAFVKNLEKKINKSLMS